MKIVYAHNSDISQKSANRIQVLSMCKAFVELGHEVVLLVPENTSETGDTTNTIREEFEIGIGFTLKYIPVFTFLEKLKKHTSFIFFRKLLMKENPDMFITRDILYLYKGIKSNYDSVFELHNSKFHNGMKLLNLILKKIFFSIVQDKKCRLIIAISEQLRQYWLREGVDNEKIVSLHDGFDSKMFKEELDKNTCRNRLKLALDKQIVTYTGNLYTNRGIDQIIKLAGKLPKVLFLIVGGPEKYKKQLEAIVFSKGLNNIILSGHVDHSEILYYLFASDVLLGIWTNKVPTINYCSPLKIFEYMASGRKIVAHGFPPILEVLKHNHNAIVADPSDFNSLLNSVKTALNSNMKIGNRARTEAFEMYSWEIRAKIIIDIIEK